MIVFKKKNAVEQYAATSADMSEEEKRELEETLLLPDTVPPITTTDPNPMTPLTRYVKVYFASQEEYDTFCDLIPCGFSHETTTRHSAMLLAALKQEGVV